MKLVPLSDRVVLKQCEAEETTKSGIILTSSAQEKPQEAEVIAVGPGGMVDGKEVTMDATKGTKVAYAEISYSGVVTGDITYITANQAAYANASLKVGSYNFEAANQSATVAADSITGKTNAQTVTVANLKELLKQAKANDNQTIEVYNTNAVETASGEVASDMYVIVTAWDGKTTAKYVITVDNTAV